jgi:hypothetical protein
VILFWLTVGSGGITPKAEELFAKCASVDHHEDDTRRINEEGQLTPEAVQNHGDGENDQQDRPANVARLWDQEENCGQGFDSGQHRNVRLSASVRNQGAPQSADTLEKHDQTQRGVEKSECPANGQ